MPLVAWSEEYSVNVREIDDQHKRLFSILNRLFDAKGSNQERETLGMILSELLSYAETHFATEERYMRRHAYPALAAHVREHQVFIQQLSDFRQRFEDGRAGLDVMVLFFLLTWLRNHILINDRAYGPFLNERGVR